MKHNKKINKNILIASLASIIGCTTVATACVLSTQTSQQQNPKDPLTISQVTLSFSEGSEPDVVFSGPRTITMNQNAMFGSIAKKLPTVTREGYKFVYWKGTVVNHYINTTKVASDDALVPVWAKEEISLSWESQDVSLGTVSFSSSSISAGTTFGQIQKPEITIVNRDYKFDKWIYESGTPVSQTDVLEVDTKIIATFITKPEFTRTIRVKPNDPSTETIVGETTIEVEKGISLDKVNLPNATKTGAIAPVTGYYVKGYSTTQGAEVPTPLEQIFANEDLDIYPVFGKLYSVSFELNGYEIKSGKQILTDVKDDTFFSDIAKPELVEMDSRIFTFWGYSTGSSEGEEILGSTTVGTFRSLNIQPKAYYIERQTLKPDITYNAGSGHFAPGQTTLTIRTSSTISFEEMEKPTATKDPDTNQYYFDAWYDKPESDSTAVKIPNNRCFVENTTVYAHYLKDIDCKATVIFSNPSIEGNYYSWNGSQIVATKSETETFNEIGYPLVSRFADAELTEQNGVFDHWYYIDKNSEQKAINFLDDKVVDILYDSFEYSQDPTTKQFKVYPEFTTSYKINFSAETAPDGTGATVISGAINQIVKENSSFVDDINKPVFSWGKNYVLDYWKYSINGGATWIAVPPTGLNITSATMFKAIPKCSVEDIKILGDKQIYSSQYSYFSVDVIGAEEQGVTWKVYDNPECTVVSTKASFTGQTIIEDGRISYQLQTGNSTGKIYLKATTAIAPGQISSQAFETEIIHPFINSNNIFAYGCEGQEGWYLIDLDSACGEDNIKVTSTADVSHVIEIPRESFNYQIYIGTKVEIIPEGFLNGCTSFDKQIMFAENGNLKYIEDGFLVGCTQFKNTNVNDGQAKPLLLPSTLKYIGIEFLAECVAFNQNITIPQGVRFVGDRFMNECLGMHNSNFSISINCDPLLFAESNETLASELKELTVKISGIYAQEFINRFPLITGKRHLILAE